MKLSYLVTITCASLLGSVPVIAQSVPVSEPPPSIQPASSNPAGEPLICKYFYYNGRTLSRRECRTAHEWQRLRYATQQNISEFQIRALTQH